jgi:polysaccharide biosynthesis PFTS motif protein
MAWYSTNSKPIYAPKDKQRVEVNVSGFRDYINEHWVWNNEEIQFMKSIGIRSSVAVGPIIFQDKILESKKLAKFVITYFDVTPFQESSGFYSEMNTTKVLNSILKLANELQFKYPDKVLIQLKPKRKYHKSHSKSYISAVKEAEKKQMIQVLPCSANLYQTVSVSDLVLAIPYTSPAILSKELGVDSCFVSIGIIGWDVAQLTYGIPTMFEHEEMMSLIERQIKLKFNS